MSDTTDLMRKMKNLAHIILLLQILAFAKFASAQVTIKVEELSKPERLLPVNYVSPRGNILTLSVNVDADSLILIYDDHPFFYGMYEAYANHRPFVLSPDMVWMLICQGFSHHINADPEKYRDKIVDFSGKLSLVVESEKPLDSAEWDILIPEFAEKIRNNTKGTIAETIIADFSTTTSYEQIASEITLMETTKAYFEFVAMYAACGIPEITLLGTTEDWQKVYDKALKLSSYNLGWWIDELKPILKQFVNASKGETDVKFWRNMFKWHTQNEYGAPNIIDGWIVKFFPYDKDGKRFDLKTLTIKSNLPDEMSKADVRFIEIEADGSKEETMIELRGGFIGLEQNPENFALTPKIGWEVKRKYDEDAANLFQINEQIRTENSINLNIIDIPDVLNKLDTLPLLILNFRDGIHFPEWMKFKQIERMRLYGDITPEERDKILSWYPSVKINGIAYERKDGVLNIFADANIGSALDGIDSIGKLCIDNSEWDTDKVLDVTISKKVTKNIGTITLKTEPSQKCLKALQKQFPNTKIEWDIDADDWLY